MVTNRILIVGIYRDRFIDKCQHYFLSYINGIMLYVGANLSRQCLAERIGVIR